MRADAAVRRGRGRGFAEREGSRTSPIGGMMIDGFRRLVEGVWLVRTGGSRGLVHEEAVKVMKISPIEGHAVEPATGSPYPEPFASMASSTHFRRLGDHFGLTQLGVNLVTLDPGTQSGLRHWHTLEDEMIYVLEGEVTLQVDDQVHGLSSGMCVGFKAGDRNAHLVRNIGTKVAHYLVVGSRVPGDVAFYPDDDLAWFETETGTVAVHKTGAPYAP